MKKLPVLLFFCLISGIYMAAAAEIKDTSAKAPVPDQAAQTEAMKMIKDVFKEEYKDKAPDKRKALAGKLLEQATDPSNNAAMVYCLLNESIKVSADAGDFETALKSAETVCSRFEVKENDLKRSILESAEKTAQNQASAQIAKAWLDLAESAMADDEYPVASAAADKASKLAKKAKDTTIASSADAMKKRVAEADRNFKAVADSLAKIKENPDDPAANLVVGKYLCFIKGDCEMGLPMLVKGSDAKLAELAQNDLELADQADAIFKTAEAWWDASEQEKPESPNRKGMKQRASELYDKSIKAGLSGMQKAKAEKRIKETDGSTGNKPDKKADKTDKKTAIQYFDVASIDMVKGVKFLDWDGKSWCIDIQKSFELKKNGNSAVLSLDMTSGYERKWILFTEENPKKVKLTAEITVTKGILQIGLCPKDRSAKSTAYEFPTGDKVEIVLWCDGDKTNVTINGKPAKLKFSEVPPDQGLFSFIPSRSSEFIIHKLKFSPM